MTDIERLSLIERKSLEERVDLAVCLIRNNVLNGNHADSRLQLQELGPYALPMIVKMAFSMSDNDLDTLLRSLFWGIHCKPAEAQHTAALNNMACMVAEELESNER